MLKKVIATFIFGSGAVFTFNGGLWQLRRKQWKEGLIEQRTRMLDLEPIEVKSGPFPWRNDNLDEWEYRPVTAKGKFDHTKQMLILRKYASMNGYRVITPMTLQDGSTIIVNRGWVPLNLKSESKLWTGSDEVEVTGVLRKSEDPGKYIPENDIALNEWYYVDLDRMSRHAHAKNYQDAKLLGLQELDFTREGEMAEGEEIQEIPLRYSKADFFNWYAMPVTHLSYSIFW